jgi:hypothetical protein
VRCWPDVLPARRSPRRTELSTRSPAAIRATPTTWMARRTCPPSSRSRKLSYRHSLGSCCLEKRAIASDHVDLREQRVERSHGAAQLASCVAARPLGLSESSARLRIDEPGAHHPVSAVPQRTRSPPLLADQVRDSPFGLAPLRLPGGCHDPSAMSRSRTRSPPTGTTRAMARPRPGCGQGPPEADDGRPGRPRTARSASSVSCAARPAQGAPGRTAEPVKRMFSGMTKTGRLSCQALGNAICGLRGRVWKPACR